MPEIHLLTPKGFRAAGVAAGIKESNKLDIGLLVADQLCTAATMYTTSQVRAAPVVVGEQHAAEGVLRAIVINSGNANACTGTQGIEDALTMCDVMGELLDEDPHHILPGSTGIIGHPLPMEQVIKGIADAHPKLGSTPRHAKAFADAICTTDTKRKMAGKTVRIGGKTVTIAGVCKGAGMIGPRLGPPQATMLAYLTTDAALTPAIASTLLEEATDASFNCVTIDNHASTNDTVCLLASGMSAKVSSATDRKKFLAALTEVCQDLAKQIAADGEGATKVVEVTVKNADSVDHARAIARTIADSPLVKCAMHGNDPNWGRIISAAGYADAPFDAYTATLKLQGVTVFRNGAPVKYAEGALSKKLKGKLVKVELSCSAGKAAGKHEATVWTCDLSREYVAINADYTT